MKIVIVGAGEVGQNLTATLSDEGHDVFLNIVSGHIDEQHNKSDKGNGSSASQLAALGVDANCDAFLAMTSDDKTNVISCSWLRD